MRSIDTTIDKVVDAAELLWLEHDRAPTIRELALKLTISMGLVHAALKHARERGRIVAERRDPITRIVEPQRWSEWRVLARYFHPGASSQLLDCIVSAPSATWALKWAVPAGAIVIQAAVEPANYRESRANTAAAAHH